MRKLNKLIVKIPNWLLLGIAFTTSMIIGCFTAAGNKVTAELTTGYSFNLVCKLMLWWGITIPINAICKIFTKGFYSKKANSVYTDYLLKASKAKMGKINQISSGKIFGLVANESALLGESYGIWLNIGWALPTFLMLMWKEATYNIWMFVISISSMVIAVLMYAITDKLFAWSTEGQKARGRISAVTADNFNNIRTIKRLKEEKFALSRLKSAQDDALAYSINISKILYMRVVDAICMVPIIANVILAKDNPEMLALVIIADYAIDRVRNTAAGYMDTLIEIKGVRKNLEALNEEEPKDKPMMGESLTLKNVIFDYGNEEEKFIIDELTFKRGSRTLVFGESGEGKSSLANLISGAITPTIGSVPPVDCYYIWQETESIDDTLWNNIVFDNKDDVSEEEVLQLMKELNMLDWFNRREDGFETMIGEKGCRLSSGQKQRLNIIRLILTMRHHPNYLFIIDEITSNLDSKTRKLAIDLIDKECKSTLIAISHNEGFDSICDHAVFVENHSFKVVK